MPHTRSIPAPVVCVFAPTEVTVVVTFGDVTAPDVVTAGAVSILPLHCTLTLLPPVLKSHKHTKPE